MTKYPFFMTVTYKVYLPKRYQIFNVLPFFFKSPGKRDTRGNNSSTPSGSRGRGGNASKGKGDSQKKAEKGKNKCEVSIELQ